MSGRVRLSFAVGALVGALVGVVAAAPGAGATPKGSALVMPVNSSVHGRTYGEWSAAWWQWAFSLPDNHHPLTDTADCSTGQSNHVWFLGATFTQADAAAAQVVAGAQRDCTVPPGTFLFVPIINAEASTLEGNGDTEEELLAVASSLMDLAGNMSIEIDGTSVPNVDGYRVQSPLFTYGPLPDRALFALPEGATSPAVGDGAYVMVKPLSVGTHTIQFHGEVPDFNFTVDMTYHITVAPGHH